MNDWLTSCGVYGWGKARSSAVLSSNPFRIRRSTMPVIIVEEYAALPCLPVDTFGEQ